MAGCLEGGGRLSVQLVEETAPGIFAQLRTRGGRVLSTVPAVDEERPAARHLGRPILAANIEGLARLRKPPSPAGTVSDDCRDAFGGSSETASKVADAASSGGKPAGEASSLFVTTPAGRPGSPGYRLRVALLSNDEVLVLGVPLGDTGATLARLLAIELAVSGAALALALGLGFLLVRLGTKPLLEVEQTAEAIMEGDLAARVPERFGAKSEMGRLTRVMNRMLGRISAEFSQRDQVESALRRSEGRMRRFLADASHELRTPVAAVSAYAELFGRAAASRPGDLARILDGIQNETARMSRLVADLMLLANLDEGHPLEQHAVELVAVCAEAVHTARAVGSQWPVSLRASEPVEVVGDEARLRQVVDNLLSNVRAHTPAGTESTLSVYQEGAAAIVELADQGPGLSEEGQDRVFERFFREEVSRTRESGGAGLGLAIVQAVVRAHGGSVAVSDTPGGGATFAVRLPLSTTDAGTTPAS
jgi:two-component system OmpR family sensor kinase